MAEMIKMCRIVISVHATFYNSLKSILQKNVLEYYLRRLTQDTYSEYMN